MGALTTRRGFHRAAALTAGAFWLAPLAQQLARAAEKPQRGPAQSLIILWMQGGPSQLETFDPHPNSPKSDGVKAINTNVKGIQLAEGLPQVAEQMDSIALIRSLVSKEGDHERGTATLKTGFRPDPTIDYPSLGAILCQELPKGSTDIPRHVSILPSQWPARGGFLGDQHNAFLMTDPAGPVPDTVSFRPAHTEADRLKHLNVAEAAFAKGRRKQVDATSHSATMRDARAMMTSEQLKSFDVSHEPLALRKRYGDNPFGRGCLAARRLIQVGVRCVEVTLAGWDTHANNKAFTAQQNTLLDPALATLLADLKEHSLLKSTLVICMGEFGRTPSINPAGGRDHWPTGFSVALAGGRVQGGQVVGETNPDGTNPKDGPAMIMANATKNPSDFVSDAVTVEDLTASIFSAFDIEYDKLLQTPIGRTAKYSEGSPVDRLFAKKPA